MPEQYCQIERIKTIPANFELTDGLSGVSSLFWGQALVWIWKKKKNAFHEKKLSLDISICL